LGKQTAIPNNNLEEKIPTHQALYDAGYDLIFLDWKDIKVFDHYEYYNIQLTDEHENPMQDQNGNPVYESFKKPVYRVSQRGGQDYIQRNAYLVESTIDYINAQLESNGYSAQKLNVIALSMGGLVARWAILDMEEHEKAHNIENFWSWDSPHNGANIPVGLQVMLEDFNELKISIISKLITIKVSKLKPVIPEKYSVLTSPAASAMLLCRYHGGKLWKNFETLQNEFDHKGRNRDGDIKDCAFKAISNGSLNNIGQVYSSGALMAEVHSSASQIVHQKGDKGWEGFWTAILEGFGTSIRVDAEIRAQASSGSAPVYSRTTYSKILGFLMEDNFYGYALADSRGLDDAPGGFTTLGRDIGGVKFNVRANLFIPAASSIALRARTLDNLQTNFSNVQNVLANNLVRVSSYVGMLQPSICFSTRVNGELDLFPEQVNQIHCFNNYRTTAFLMYDLLRSISGLEDITSLDNQKFNFGKLTDNIIPDNYTEGLFSPRVMTNSITQEITLRNNSLISVNAAGPIGFIHGNNTTTNLNKTNFDLDLSKGIDCKESYGKLLIDETSMLKLGDWDLTNRAIVSINSGCVIDNSGTIKIDDNSRLIVQKGGKLIIRSGASLLIKAASLIVEKGGELIIENDPIITFENLGKIEISGTVHMGRTNIKNMDGYIDLKEGGQWYVHGDLTLKSIDRAKTILKNVHGAINYFDNVNLDVSNGTVLSEVGGGTGFSFNSGAGNVTFNNVVFKYGMPLYISGLNGVFKATDCDYNDVNRSATIASANDNSKTYKVLIDKCKVYNTSISNAGFVINGIKWVKATGSQFYTNRNRWSNINQGGIGFSLIDVGNISLENCHFAKLNSAISNNSANIDMNCTYMINCVYGVNNIYISPISHVLKMRQSGMIGNRVGGQLENAILDISTPSYEWFLGNIFSDCCYPTQNLTFIPPQFHKAIESGFMSGEEGQQIPDDVPGDRLPACGYIFKGTVSNQLLPPEYLIPASYNYWFDNALNCMSKVSNLTHFISGRWTDLDTDPSNTFGDMRDIMSCTEIMMDRKTDPASLKTKKTGENAVINIFPNPGTNVMKIEASDIAKSFELYDLSGRRVTNGEISQYTEINLSELTSGVYYILIRDAENDLIFKQKYVVIR